MWLRAQVVRFCPFWYIAFDSTMCIVFVATAVWLFCGCWRCRLDYMSERFWTWEAMRGHDKRIFVAHKNHSIEHNRVISNHSKTPLPYEDVVQQPLLSQYSSSTVWEVEGRLTFTTKKKWNFQPPAAVWWSRFRRFCDMLVFLLQWRVFWRRLSPLTAGKASCRPRYLKDDSPR